MAKEGTEECTAKSLDLVSKNVDNTLHTLHIIQTVKFLPRNPNYRLSCPALM